MEGQNFTTEDLIRMMDDLDDRNEQLDKIRRRLKMRNDIYEQFKQGSGKGTEESSSN